MLEDVTLGIDLNNIRRWCFTSVYSFNPHNTLMEQVLSLSLSREELKAQGG